MATDHHAFEHVKGFRSSDDLLYAFTAIKGTTNRVLDEIGDIESPYMATTWTPLKTNTLVELFQRVRSLPRARNLWRYRAAPHVVKCFLPLRTQIAHLTTLKKARKPF